MSKQSLSASERINILLDESSFVEVGAYVEARSTDFNIQNKETPKDGVITGYGVIGDKLVYVYSQDASVLGGAVGEMPVSDYRRLLMHLMHSADFISSRRWLQELYHRLLQSLVIVAAVQRSSLHFRILTI